MKASARDPIPQSSVVACINCGKQHDPDQMYCEKSSPLSGPRATPTAVIVVKRPDDPAPWIWGGSYDDDGLDKYLARADELRVVYPDYEWKVRVG